MVKYHHKGNFELKCSLIIFELTYGWAYVGLSKGISINNFQEDHTEGCNVLPKYGMKAE